MKTAVTRTSRHYLLAKKPWSNLHLKNIKNWKVQPILMWMEFIFPIIWMLGVTFSVDEITMIFKGHHVEKINMTYKTEGDGLKTDDIFRKDTHIKYLYGIILCQKISI